MGNAAFTLKMRNTIANLIKLADDFDSSGMPDVADNIDKTVQDLSQTPTNFYKHMVKNSPQTDKPHGIPKQARDIFAQIIAHELTTDVMKNIVLRRDYSEENVKKTTELMGVKMKQHLQSKFGGFIVPSGLERAEMSIQKNLPGLIQANKVLSAKILNDEVVNMITGIVHNNVISEVPNG